MAAFRVVRIVLVNRHLVHERVVECNLWYVCGRAVIVLCSLASDEKNGMF